MSEGQHRYFIIHKPYNMVSQFVSSHDVTLLGQLHFNFPEGTHAIGRLDNNSEGLLLLTTNKIVTRLLFQDVVPHKRTYLVKVKNIVSTESLLQLQTGVRIRIKGGGFYVTPACDVAIVESPAHWCAKENEEDKNIPHTWLRISLTEGKFHQVRKMVAAVHHRCKRLIRVSIEDMELGNLLPGEVHEMEEEAFFRKLHLKLPSLSAHPGKEPTL